MELGLSALGESARWRSGLNNDNSAKQRTRRLLGHDHVAAGPDTRPSKQRIGNRRFCEAAFNVDQSEQGLEISV
jgi:hypothetical protein